MTSRRSTLIDPVRRGVALGTTLSFHLALLILALRFTGWDPAPPAGQRNIQASLQLRLLAPSAPRRAKPGAMAVDTVAVRTRQTARPKPATRASTPHMATQAPSPVPLVNRFDVPPATVTHNYTDGGFSERLQKVRQRSHAAPQLPGTDVPLVSGIALTNRDEQGIGALVRKTKRLFGIPDRHCIDADVKKHLTPRELNERYGMAPSDVDQASEAYHCNRPMGLSF